MSADLLREYEFAAIDADLAARKATDSDLRARWEATARQARTEAARLLEAPAGTWEERR